MHRAPNFIAGAEQSFLDEVAEAAGKDPIAFRLELLERAQKEPVGEDNDYDPARYAGVLQLVRDKANWGQGQADVHRGVAAYFCHNSYAAHVLDLAIEEGKPVVKKGLLRTRLWYCHQSGCSPEPDGRSHRGRDRLRTLRRDDIH